MEGWLPCLDNMDKLHQFLGLSDKKPIPDPIKFEKPDPLGAKQVIGQKEEDLASTLSKFKERHFNNKKFMISSFENAGIILVYNCPSVLLLAFVCVMNFVTAIDYRKALIRLGLWRLIWTFMPVYRVSDIK